MDATDLCFTPATTLAAMIRSRQISPVEVMEAVLQRIAALNPRLNAYLAVDAEGARAQAQAAEAAVMRGATLSPLHGLPVSIKDLEPSAGLRCTYGSKFFEDNIAEMDGMVTSRVKAAGGIVIGKTNTSHYGYKDMCDNLLGPPCRNPWRLDRTSGASSGGAGAAVAAGLGPLAHGSDGAGSIRIPAALCGVFGLKPSFGRVPNWPNVDIWAARSHNGPITRTVADAALLLHVMAGPDPRDPTSIDSPPEDYVAAVAQPLEALRGLRVAWSADFGYAPVEPEVRQLTAAAAERFRAFGCEVDAVNPGWDDPRAHASTLWYVSYATRLGERYEQRPDWFEPSLAAMIEAGRRVSGVQHGQAQLARTVFYEQARRFFERYDLLLTPQMPLGAWSVEHGPDTIDGTPTPSMFDRLNFTFPFNQTGQPAASVPCGFTSDGLPVALQIVGRWHADRLVLQAAAACEHAAPWAQARPAL
ncbi:MAG: amidase [Candidatus Tectomicrobia bacterium]|uniref:Amidase n=1 Tax=Tectimicrobiota bacterium TaxID=2528274 RepID=A0A938B348_UNCTE|nr:amidase [Candidatus Tectomicrobia bacterium]